LRFCTIQNTWVPQLAHAASVEDELPKYSHAVTGDLPPSYNQIRNLDRPEIAGLIATGYHVNTCTPARVSTAIRETASNNGAGAPLTSSNLASLEDITYGEVARHVHMSSRISAVPNYPVALAAAQNEIRASSVGDANTEDYNRPGSGVSEDTVDIYLAVGQLPGAAPLSMENTTRGLHGNEESLTTQLDSSPLPETAQEMRVQQIVRNLYREDE
jgi:hypothetical protein